MEDTALKTKNDFRELPEPVKLWLSSSSLTFLVETINKRLGFKDEGKMRVIPSAVLRLVLGNLAPEDFINDLAVKLGISFSSVKMLAHEIEEKLLKPIEIPLRTELGIDIAIIHLAELSIRESSPPITKQPDTSLPMLVSPITPSIPPIGEKQWKKVEPAVVIKPVKPEEELKPFILHEEVVPYSAAVSQKIQPKHPIVKKIDQPTEKTAEPIKPKYVAPPVAPIKPTSKPPEMKIAPPAPPIKIEIGVKKINPLSKNSLARPPETPANPNPNLKRVDKKNVSRVIHYSSFKTPLVRPDSPLVVRQSSPLVVRQSSPLVDKKDGSLNAKL